jgi:diguanylate cyclase (GGDEF)-like protein
MIRALYTTRTGELLVGTDGGGFGYFRNGVFSPISTENVLPGWGEQRSFLEAPEGSVWVSGNGATTLLQVNRGKVSPHFEYKADIRAMAYDQKGNLWAVGAEPQLSCRQPDGSLKTWHYAPQLPHTTYTALLVDRQNGLWIGTQDKGLLRYQDGKFWLLGQAEGLRSKEINALLQDRNGNIWVGTKNGLYRWNGARFDPFTRLEGLPSAEVKSLFEDREGNLWLGTGASLTRFSTTKLIPLEFGSATSPAFINEMCSAPDGAAWVATSQGVYQYAAGKIKHFGLADGLPNESVQFVCTDMQGVVYVACEGGQVLQRRGERFEPLQGVKAEIRLGADRDGLVLVNGLGKLLRYQNGKVTSVPMPYDKLYVFSFYRDYSGTLWAATDYGVGRVLKDRMELFADGLPWSTHVLGIVAEEAGGLWLATDKGLARFQDGACRLFGKKEGLPDDNLYQIQKDDLDRLWIGCNAGVLCIEKTALYAFERGTQKQITYTLYDATEGVRHVPILFGAIRVQGKDMWFHGEKGVTIVDPVRLRINSHIPVVSIETVLVNRTPTPLAETLSLAPGKTDIEFHFAALSFTAPEKVRYRYRLLGFDKDWIDAGQRRDAYYTNLPPKEYQFQVMAGNEDWVWSTTPTQIALYLNPYFYQTWWFRILTPLLILGLILGTVRWRVWSLKQRNRLLGQKVAYRTAELQRTNGDLREAQDALEGLNAELEASNDELVASNAELAEANEKLASLATTDGLTGLANHRTFQERLRQELALTERIGCSLTLLLFDVDHFKQYNDSFGHPAGDEVLRTMGQLLLEHVREMDIVARYGGEEFAVIMPHTDEYGARDAAERIRSVVAEYAFPKRQITLSIGATIVSGGNMRIPEEIIQDTDDALYRAKRAGRNCVVFSHECVIAQVA